MGFERKLSMKGIFKTAVWSAIEKNIYTFFINEVPLSHKYLMNY